jgi:hypothetical protein
MGGSDGYASIQLFHSIGFYLVLEHRIHSYQEHLRANMHISTEAIGRSITLTTPKGKMIRYKFCLEFKDIRLNNLKGVSLEVMAIVREGFGLQGETNQDMGSNRKKYSHQNIKFCQVQWSHHTEEEATWELRKKLFRLSPIPIC